MFNQIFHPYKYLNSKLHWILIWSIINGLENIWWWSTLTLTAEIEQ